MMCQHHHFGEKTPAEGSDNQEVAKKQRQEAYRYAYEYYREELRRRGYTGALKPAIVFHHGTVPETPAQWVNALEELINDYDSLL